MAGIHQILLALAAAAAGEAVNPWDLTLAGYTNKSLNISAHEGAPFGLVFSPDDSKLFVCGNTNDGPIQYGMSTPGELDTAVYSTKYNPPEDTKCYSTAFNSDGTKMYLLGTNGKIWQYSLGTPYDLNGTITYDTKFYVMSEDAGAYCIRVISDTLFFMVGHITDTVHQYTMTGGDISTAVYTGYSFTHGEAEATTLGLDFSEDGTKMFITGTDQIIYQYTLATGFDLNDTVTYDNVSYAVTQEDDPYVIVFNSNGTQFYTVGTTNDTVYQYSTSAAIWDLTYTKYTNKAFDVSTEDSQMYGLHFNNTGTIMYAVGSVSDTIYQYTLSTPWDVTTATYSTKSFLISGQEGTPFGLHIKDDGKTFWVVGTATDDIFQYTMSTAWDISTAAYASKFLSIGGNPDSVFFKPDGTTAWVMVYTSGLLYQINMTTPWDISTGSLGVSFSVATQDNQPYDIYFKPDGTKLFLIGDQNNTVYQYSLETPWDVTTASYDSVSVDVSGQETLAYGLAFGDSGAKFYALGSNSGEVHQYQLFAEDPGWTIEYAAYSTKSFSVAGQETSPSGLAFSSDGTKMYAAGGTNDTVYQYTLSTAWDVSTASYASKSLNISSEEANVYGLRFKSDGTKLWVIGITGDTVYQYTMSTPWDVSTATYDSKSLSVTAQDNTPTGIFLSADGTKAYVLGFTNKTVFQYTLSTPFDISTGSYASKSHSVNSEDTAPYDLYFSDDGTRMFVTGDTNDKVYQYTLSTPWDVSTASYDSLSFTMPHEFAPFGLAFGDNGNKFYIVGPTNDTVYQYNI